MTTILILVACLSASPADVNDTPKPEVVRLAVEKALRLILKSTAEYPERRDCFSCHHQAVPVLALSSAKRRGFAIPVEAIDGPVEHTEADLRTSLESYRKGAGQGGGVTRAGYAMFTLEIGGKKPDEVTDAVVGYLLKKDESGDHWRATSNRPPSEASDFAATYLALRALAAYGKEDQKDRIAVRVEKARRWLEATKPGDTEDRVFRLLGMRAASSPDAEIQKASDDLLASRRDDGGWSQLDGGTSDAYATGSALVALHLAGRLATDSPEYRGSLRFLIADQRGDGSWFVKSRSKPFQPYFESGFPHGKDHLSRWLRCWCGFGSESLRSGAWGRLRTHCEGAEISPRDALLALGSGSLKLPNTRDLVVRFKELEGQLARLGSLTGRSLIDSLFPENEPWSDPVRALAGTIDADRCEPKDLLDHLRTSISQPELPTDVDYVRVMSLHKSKGLTAEMVVVVGCVEGAIPRIDHDLGVEEKQAMHEEQRRLFYVALTRPTKSLVISNFTQLPREFAHRMRIPLISEKSSVGARSLQPSLTSWVHPARSRSWAPLS